MSNNYYANGRVAVLSSRLLTADKFTKLIECGNLTEAVRALGELGYVDGAQGGTSNYEQSLQVALADAVNTFVELCSDMYVTRYYMARYDYHNAKTIAKCKYNRIDALQYCYEFGSVAPARLSECILADEYSNLPTAMAEALAVVDNMHVDGNDSPQAIDILLDKAMFADMRYCASKAKYKALRNICAVEIDCTNILTLFRLRMLGMSPAVQEDMIIDGGSIDKQWLVDNFTADYDVVLDRLYGSAYKAIAQLCIEGRIADAEMLATKIKRELLVGTDIDTLAPVLSYYNSKIVEIDKIRYIMMCIKSGMDKDTTKDRLKELYA